MNVLLISNETSGSSDAETVREIERILGSLGDVRSLSPESVDSLTDAVAGAARDRDFVVVAGGDGTFNCTINALGDDLASRAFGLIPMGTGNDFARTLGLPDDPVDAARGLVDGEDVRIDVGRAEGAGVERLFVNACMGGFPVDVDVAVEESDLKRRLGPLAFWVGGAKALTDITRFEARMGTRAIDDCVAVGVGNGRTCGGGIAVWPSAHPDDGALDACALPATNPAQAVRLAAKVRDGSHEDLDEVVTARAARVEIDADPMIEFNVDGELVGLKSPASFEVVKAVTMRVPRRSRP
jgi:diacylglycerol kinase (ATP)